MAGFPVLRHQTSAPVHLGDTKQGGATMLEGRWVFVALRCMATYQILAAVIEYEAGRFNPCGANERRQRVSDALLGETVLHPTQRQDVLGSGLPCNGTGEMRLHCVDCSLRCAELAPMDDEAEAWIVKHGRAKEKEDADGS